MSRNIPATSIVHDSVSLTYRFKHEHEKTGKAAHITSTQCIQRIMANDAMLFVISGLQAALRQKAKELKDGTEKKIEESKTKEEEAFRENELTARKVEKIKGEIQKAVQKGKKGVKEKEELQKQKDRAMAAAKSAASKLTAAKSARLTPVEINSLRNKAGHFETVVNAMLAEGDRMFFKRILVDDPI